MGSCHLTAGEDEDRGEEPLTARLGKTLQRALTLGDPGSKGRKRVTAKAWALMEYRKKVAHELAKTVAAVQVGAGGDDDDDDDNRGDGGCFGD
jgi:hypothetical protein